MRLHGPHEIEAELGGRQIYRFCRFLVTNLPIQGYVASRMRGRLYSASESKILSTRVVRRNLSAAWGMMTKRRPFLGAKLCWLMVSFLVANSVVNFNVEAAPGRIGIGVEHSGRSTQKSASQVLLLLAEEARNHGYTPVLRAKLPTAPASSETFIKKSKSSLKAARAAFDQFDFRGCIRTAQKTTASLLTTHEPRSSVRALLLESLMLEAAAHLLADEKIAARKNLVRAIGLHSSPNDLVLDKSLFNPAMREFVAKVQRGYSKMPTIDLGVESSPSGAAVLVNGRYVGVTPTIVSKVGPGIRSVQVIRQGYTMKHQWALLQPNQMASVDVELGPAESIAKGTLKDRLFEQGVKDVIRAEVNADGSDLRFRFYYHPSKKRSTKISEFVLARGADETGLVQHIADMDIWSTLVQRDLVVSPVIPNQRNSETPTAQVDDEPMLVKSSSGFQRGHWIVASSGGVLMATGAVFWALAASKHDEFLQSPQGSPSMAALRKQGRTYAIVGDISFGLGTAAVLGSLFHYLNHREASPAIALGKSGSVNVGPTHASVQFKF